MSWRDVTGSMDQDPFQLSTVLTHQETLTNARAINHTHLTMYKVRRLYVRGGHGVAQNGVLSLEWGGAFCMSV